MSFINVQDVSWLPVADAIVKATLLLAGAAVCSTLLRRGTAAARHLIWTLALLSSLVLPILSIALPRFQLPLLTVAAVAEPAPIPDVTAPPLRQRAPRAAAVLPPKTPVAQPVDFAAAPPSNTPTSRVALPAASWQTLLAVVWLAGILAILSRLALGVIAVQWLARRSESAHHAPWISLACKLAAELGVSPRVRFLRSARATMPIACGVFRPAVVMPADADTWPAERLRIVLLHELAHVKRRDCLTHMLAQLTCALYWFNPLAWVAARHVRTERERACDDLVLAAGTRGPDYADQLLEIARVMRSGRFPGVLAGASLAMAYRSQLEGRLMAILDPKVPRAGLTRVRAALATALFTGAVLPLAAVQPWVYTEQTSTPGLDAERAATVETAAPSQTPAPQPSPKATPAARSAAAREARVHEQDIVQGTTQGTIQGTVQGTMQGTVQGIAQGAIKGFAAAIPAVEWEVAAVEWQEQKPQPEGARAKGTDPKAVAALTAALKDTDKEVREAALHALVQLRDPSIFDVLVEALKDSSAEVRHQAAFGLGELRDRRAVPALIGALKDADGDVRQQAVFALGQLRDPAAVEAIIGAVRDAKPDIRQQAVFALGEIRDRRAVEPLISALKDTDADVRQQAAFALGQIRDRAAVEALVIALKDSDADVRQQVAFALGQLGDARAIDGLTAALKDTSADVRQQAAFALGQLAR